MTRLPYGADPSQFGELRVPGGAGRHPLVIVVHGGFWRAKWDLRHIAPFCEALTAAGFATWNLEYRRLGNGGGWPVTFEDVARGAAYVETLAEEYAVDAGRVIAAGHSAGGQLAMLLGSPVRGVVALAGVTDLRRAWELGLSRGAVREFLGGTPQEAPGRYAVASPIERVMARVPCHMPVRLIHGQADRDVPHEISVRYTDVARAAGNDAELISLPGAGHFEPIDPRTAHWREVLAQIERISAMV